ncbi:N,N-dimethylformamidase beta subunit family domain-containing protein [Streptomyces sp. INA 01156]
MRRAAEDVVGYTDKSSVLPGEGFGLYVSTTSPVFRVSAYRVGWYGGAQARLVWRSETMDGRVQAASHLISATRTVRAGWERTAEVRTDGWPEGAYLLRLDASSGHQRYVPLIVRSATARRSVSGYPFVSLEVRTTTGASHSCAGLPERSCCHPSRHRHRRPRRIQWARRWLRRTGGPRGRRIGVREVTTGWGTRLGRRCTGWAVCRWVQSFQRVVRCRDAVHELLFGVVLGAGDMGDEADEDPSSTISASSPATPSMSQSASTPSSRTTRIPNS